MSSFHVFALAAALFLTSVCGRGQTVQDISIEGAVGKLSAVLHKPMLKKGGKCPLVIICHGFMGNKESSLLTGLADSLQACGIASIRFDFNGHGKSEGDFVSMTVPNEIDDAKCVYRYAVSLPFVDTSRIGMAGHSQGGVVAGMVSGELGERIAAVVLMAPAAVLRDDAIRGNTMGAMYDPLSPPDSVPLFNGLKLGGAYIRTAFRLPIYETSARYHGAACLIHGTGDRVVPYTYSERYHEMWTGSEMHIMDGADHGFTGVTGRVASVAANYLRRFLLQ